MVLEWIKNRNKDIRGGNPNVHNRSRESIEKQKASQRENREKNIERRRKLYRLRDRLKGIGEKE